MRSCKLVDKNMIANPVTLRPMFEADEAMRAMGGPAYLVQLTGSGSRADRRARFRHPDLRAGAAARADRRRPRDGREGGRHQRLGRSEDADRGCRGRALPRRRGGRRAGQRQDLRAGDARCGGAGRAGAQFGRASVGHHDRARQRQRPDRRPAPFRPDHPRRPPRHGQDRARHQHRLQRGRSG